MVVKGMVVDGGKCGELNYYIGFHMKGSNNMIKDDR